MRRFEVTLTIKVGISATSAIQAGSDVVRFLKSYMLIHNAEFDKYQNKGIVLQPPVVSSENVKELLF